LRKIHSFPAFRAKRARLGTNISGASLCGTSQCRHNGNTEQNRRSSMKAFLKVALLAAAVVLPVAGAQAQAYQGSNQAADNALNWAAAGGHHDGAYARYEHRRQR